MSAATRPPDRIAELDRQRAEAERVAAEQAEKEALDLFVSFFFFFLLLLLDLLCLWSSVCLVGVAYESSRHMLAERSHSLCPFLQQTDRMTPSPQKSFVIAACSSLAHALMVADSSRSSSMSSYFSTPCRHHCYRVLGRKQLRRPRHFERAAWSVPPPLKLRAKTWMLTV